MSNRINICVIQETLTQYRAELFKRLSQLPEYRVTIAHARSQVRGEPTLCTMSLRQVSFGGLYWLKGAWNAANGSDVVIIPFNLRSFTCVRFVASTIAAKVILWGHGFGKSRMAVPLRCQLARRAGAVLVYGDPAASQLVDRGIDANKIFVAHNTIHVPNAGFDPSCERSSFLFVGRLQPRKRVHDLIAAFAELKPRLPDHVRLEIVGDGPMRQALEAQVANFGLNDRVIFHGGLTDADRLKAIFHRALAYVSPGAVGLGVLHAFAYGVPVITDRNVRHGPEIENVSHGESGILFSGSVAALADAMAQVALSDGLSKRLGERAYRHYISERSMDRMVEAFRAAVAFTASHGL